MNSARIYWQGGTADPEDYDRTVYQSTHTVAGRVAPLPLRLEQAWDEAHAEYERRERRSGLRSV